MTNDKWLSLAEELGHRVYSKRLFSCVITTFFSNKKYITQPDNFIHNTAHKKEHNNVKMNNKRMFNFERITINEYKICVELIILACQFVFVYQNINNQIDIYLTDGYRELLTVSWVCPCLFGNRIHFTQISTITQWR